MSVATLCYTALTLILQLGILFPSAAVFRVPLTNILTNPKYEPQTLTLTLKTLARKSQP